MSYSDEPQPEEQENVYLSLECRRGFINMTWITPPSIHAENISLYTSCLNTSDNKQLHKVKCRLTIRLFVSLQLVLHILGCEVFSAFLMH